MPECFKDTYPNTRVIIDHAELFCQKQFSLTIQSTLVCRYKHHISSIVNLRFLARSFFFKTLYFLKKNTLKKVQYS